MPFTLHGAATTTLVSNLRNLSAFLTKAEASAEARKFDVAVLLQSRLAPDMAPLVRQVQFVTDHATYAMSRLGGHDRPAFPDTETTVPELKERIARAVAYVESVPAADVDASADRTITFKAGPMDLSFSGADYLTRWALPNFYFHLTAAYAILRHNGVDLGKRDFLMGGAS
jgi:uncharacterized protein